MPKISKVFTNKHDQRVRMYRHPWTQKWVTKERLHEDCLLAMIRNTNGLLTEGLEKDAQAQWEDKHGNRSNPSEA